MICFQRLLYIPLLALTLLGCGTDNNFSAVSTSLQMSDHNTAERCSPTRLPTSQHMVTSWRTAPSDALITHPISALTVRQFFAPHHDSDRIRLRLSNHYSNLPVTLENIHIAKEITPGKAELQPNTECLLTFAGKSKITIPAGQSAVSDTISYPLRAFERVGVSFYAPTLTPQVTRHLNANEILFMSIPGDFTKDPNATPFMAVPDGYTSNFLAIEALEVAAPKSVRTIVTVGDSITDGSGSTTQILSGLSSPMTSSDQRYPNHLQRRILEAKLPFTVANAGIGGNELINDALLPQFGASLLKRFDHDVLSVTGLSHILLMIGTNDLGNPKLGQSITPEDLITGYKSLIERAHQANVKLILGTIPPAEGTVLKGLPILGNLPLPIGILHGSAEAKKSRDAINAWIRTQTLSDGIVDFDQCLADPQNPGYLADEFNSGDNLHPSPAGYLAMAECIDLNLFITH